MNSKNHIGSLDDLLKKHDELKSKIVTKGMRQFTNSNIDRIRKLKRLEEQMESLRNKGN
jgi:hypothetical protein